MRLAGPAFFCHLLASSLGRPLLLPGGVTSAAYLGLATPWHVFGGTSILEFTDVP